MDRQQNDRAAARTIYRRRAARMPRDQEGAAAARTPGRVFESILRSGDTCHAAVRFRRRPAFFVRRTCPGSMHDVPSRRRCQTAGCDVGDGVLERFNEIGVGGGQLIVSYEEATRSFFWTRGGRNQRRLRNHELPLRIRQQSPGTDAR